MDKLGKLQKILGDEDVVDDTSPFEIPSTKPKHLYEGTDSEDEILSDTNVTFQLPSTKPKHLYEGTDSEDEILSEANVVNSAPKSKESEYQKFVLDSIYQPVVYPSETNPNIKKEYDLQLGELASEYEVFCPWKAVKSYPWKFIGQTNREKVVQLFYTDQKYSDEHWDFFYIYRETLDLNQAPIILVPTAQVTSFLNTINRILGINLTIPWGRVNAGFQVQFDNDGNPRPRYLGHSTSAEMASNLHKNVPPSYYKPRSELDSLTTPDAQSKAVFRAKMELIIQLQKNKKAATAEKRKKDRIDRQKTWCHSLKRIQRYLGLREVRQVDEEAIQASLDFSGWADKRDFDVAVKEAFAKLGPSASFDAEKLAPYTTENDVVFVCVDIEAYERNSRQITEIGIATLDTRDIQSLTPGKQGEEWMKKIRARHFRVKEHANLHNTEFVAGCADKFDFGESEFIALKDAAKVIASCFKPPFSKSDATEEDQEQDGPKRNIVLVGHDTSADINFMQQLGYDVHNLSNLLEIADTASMWRYLKRETNPRNLGMILYELDITSWHLHNAGNDAVYTLQVMIAIAIKHIEDKKRAKEDKEKDKNLRISESIKEAAEAALEKEEGWSSSGNNSDGGDPGPLTARKHRIPSMTASKQTAESAPQPTKSPILAFHLPMIGLVKPLSLPQAPQLVEAGPNQFTTGWDAYQNGETSIGSQSFQAEIAAMSLDDDWGITTSKAGDEPIKEEETHTNGVRRPSWDTYKGW